MSGGGNTTGFGGQDGFGGGQSTTQPMQPQFQPNTTGWNRPTFTTDPTKMSPTQSWWTQNPMGASATLNMNLQNQAAFNASQTPIDRNTFNKTRNVTVSGGEGGDYTTTENYFDKAGYDAAVAAQKAQTYTPLNAQEALNKTLRDQIQGAMGNYGKMVDYANRTGISTADIQNAIGGNTDMYTYMNRPNYQTFSDNGQYNPAIYQPSYQNYNVGNPMAISQYGQGTSNPYGIGLQLASTPFNPYMNTYQTTPFSAPTAQQYYPKPTQLNYGPSQPIVSRSAGLRGTPNVVRRAEGGIASLMDSVE